MKKYALLSLLLAFILAGCGQNTSPNTVTTNESAPETSSLQIITSFYPLAFMTEQIVGDKIEVINLSGNTDVHLYQPSPQDLVMLNNASLVIFQGAELEPWADGVITDLEKKGIQTLEATHNLPLQKTEEHDDEHEDEEHEEADTEKHEDEHYHGEFDPHTWLDPVLAQDMVRAIVASVVTIDPKNDTLYQTNANNLINRFQALDQAFQTQLAQCNQKEVIVSHDAYGYLAKRYNLELHTIAGINPKDEPSAQILAELKKEAEEGITHILIEENSVRRFAETLAQETGLTTLAIDPLEKGNLGSKKDYFEVMNQNLQNLVTALDCQ